MEDRERLEAGGSTGADGGACAMKLHCAGRFTRIQPSNQTLCLLVSPSGGYGYSPGADRRWF